MKKVIQVFEVFDKGTRDFWTRDPSHETRGLPRVSTLGGEIGREVEIQTGFTFSSGTDVGPWGKGGSRDCLDAKVKRSRCQSQRVLFVIFVILYFLRRRIVETETGDLTSY